MKKIIVLIMTCALLSSLTLVAAANQPINIEIENPYQTIQEDIHYSVDSISLTGNQGIARARNTNQELTLELSINSTAAFDMAASPKISLDEDFNQLIEIDNIMVTTDSDSKNTTLVIDAHCSGVTDTIYVQMPIISRTTEDKILQQNVNTSNIVEYTETINGETIDMFVLPFDANDFSVIPRKVSLGENEEIKSLLSNISLDDNGNPVSGYFVFVKPENYELSDTYDVIINGTFEHCDPVVAAISIE